MSIVTDEDNKQANWRKYIRIIGMGGSLKASCARLCAQLDCDNASSARRKVASMVETKKIDTQEAMTLLDAISDVEAMHKRGEQTHKINTDNAAWIPCNSGHMKRNFTHH